MPQSKILQEVLAANRSYAASFGNFSAEAVARVRLRAADQGTRRDVSVEGMSERQAARRSARPAVAIGGVAEHAQWHETVKPPKGRAAGVRRGVLARFADGSLRGAIVLGEVLGRPVSGR